MVQWQKRKHSQELFCAAQRLVGVKGGSGSGFGKITKTYGQLAVLILE
jgi:hypothetical protein